MPIQRRKTTSVVVGDMTIGSDFPIVIQAMTNTPTCDVQATTAQIKNLVLAGSELVRLTINDDLAAQAVPDICRLLKKDGVSVPLIGDFHFNGHLLLTRYPEMASSLAKYRINPGNVGHGQKHDDHFETMIKIAIQNNKPIRIGVNSGSLDPDLLSSMMEQNALGVHPESEHAVFCNAMVESALQSAHKAIELGLKRDRIILSAKTSDLQDLITIYQSLAARCAFPLHLGLTEAGSHEQGIVASSAAMGILLQQGIGDTLRISLTPDDHIPRTQEIVIAQHILQSLGIRYFRPKVVSCPGCGRTSTRMFQKMVNSVKHYIEKQTPNWKNDHPGICHMTVAVMGCVVNGPGESQHADIGISLPGDIEEPAALVFTKGSLSTKLEGKNIDHQFFELLEKFVQTNY